MNCFSEITELHKKDQEKLMTLFRASLKGFFSLIESDIYGLNKLDAYEGYDDHIGSFEFKFKKTFKQVCKTWNKKEIIQLYLDSKYGKLKSLKQKRNNLVHPKEVPDILIASEEGLNDIKECFNDYTKMLHSIMNNFFISIEIKDSEDLNELFK